MGQDEAGTGTESGASYLTAVRVEEHRRAPARGDEAAAAFHGQQQSLEG
ncbi:hypothetical protein ACX80E_12330 [Arthrobacter sp. TMN-49]